MKAPVALVAALLLSGCVGATLVSEPAASGGGGWTPVAVETRTVGLGVPGGVRLGPGVRFAGGLQILAAPGHRLHGFSDLKLVGDDLLVVTDSGDLLRATLRYDRRGRPAALSGVRFRALTGLQGQGFTSRSDGDAEGLAIAADGTVFVSFEQEPRIWSYGPLEMLRDRPAPWPAPPVPAGNDGLEALAAGPDGTLRTAAESGGVWDCSAAGCVEHVAPPAAPVALSDWRVTGMDRDPTADGWLVVERLYREPVDMRARVRRMDGDGALGEVLIELSLPSTTDNFEGVAATARPGGMRVYILSDDNDNRRQRTLLLAFDIEASSR